METEMNMGKQRTVDKTLKPLTTLTSLTPSQVTNRSIGDLGSIPIGVYKGSAAFFDLNLMVNEPLVQAEWQHILGILDGREEDYDLQTLGIVLGEAAGTAHMAQLTVPTGEVWYINTVQMTTPATGGANTIDMNWYCSLWTDRLGALGYGQAMHAANLNGAGALTVWPDDFWYTAPIVGIANKATMLRAPAGTVFTVIFTNQVAVAAAAINCTFQLFGFIGKTLVS